MTPEPAFPVFAEAYEAGRPQVVWTRLVADLETPVSAMLKLADGRPNSFLLESVEGGEIRGRYSFIGLKPDLIWRCRGDRAELNRNARFEPDGFEPQPVGALASLRAIIEESEIDIPPELPPMAAGLVGYMSYDTARLMERLPDRNPDVLGIPDGVFLRPTVMAVFDNIEDMVTVITPVWPRPGIDAGMAYDQARERLADVVLEFSRSLPYRREAPGGGGTLPAPDSNMTREQFHDMGAVAALLGTVPAAAVLAVSSVAAAQPLAVPVLPGFRRLRGGRLEPGDPGAAAGRHGDHPADRRHPAARRRPGRGQGIGRGVAGRPEGAGRAPDAARPRP
jgi:anthranilate synthase component 1